MEGGVAYVKLSEPQYASFCHWKASFRQLDSGSNPMKSNAPISFPFLTSELYETPLQTICSVSMSPSTTPTWMVSSSPLTSARFSLAVLPAVTTMVLAFTVDVALPLVKTPPPSVWWASWLPASE